MNIESVRVKSINSKVMSRKLQAKIVVGSRVQAANKNTSMGMKIGIVRAINNRRATIQWDGADSLSVEVRDLGQLEKWFVYLY